MELSERLNALTKKLPKLLKAHEIIHAADLENPSSIESIDADEQCVSPEEYLREHNIMPFGELTRLVGGIEMSSSVYSEEDIPKLRKIMIAGYIGGIKRELEYMEKLHSTSHQ